MSINDINNILSRLAGNRTRENILDLSFGLLQWMNIEPNAANKPQLLSPQTQKLKDFLAPAPQTVQPQLYRISADNQNIRVRFAVLKKLKKEYISQLVDNDPGLGSYQSFSKGLTPQNGTPFIPTQPYYIHFVTTPAYDKLILIFNQGEQKRIVTFRNRLTSTQYHKIIQSWQDIGTKPKPVIDDLLWKSLDIKEVNKEFYRQIKERFDALLGIVRTQTGTATDNQVKQFTVRLIGRYIFCWFLKEKGIIPYSLISKESIEKTANYYQNVLLKLFFETLNTKVQDRNPLALNTMFEKIPYLNGGLFDESQEDKLFANLQLDAWLLPFVEILESYDFTVDESSSQYQQVAVDPEMLGRIFENLLASQNEETEKLANQRKAFGAFYTPREIVDYMVNESIKAYLQTQWEKQIEAEKTKHINNPEPIGDIFGNKKPQQLAFETKRYELKPEDKLKIEKALESLFANNPDVGVLKKEEKTLLLSFLEQIKILDPACGSGAFPMGILHKLVELHEVLGTVKSSYELKKDILSQNIFGVDIMPMAIEIARLRAWLSLILEEEYKPTDPVHNFGVKPLPNLDFKFVCANSLIDLGLDAFIQDSKGTLREGFTQKLVAQLKGLEALRKHFFTPALESTEKEKLKEEYLQKRDEVVTAIEADSEPVLIQISQKIKHWDPFDDSQASTFFSPTWMFGIDNGFDVVIGNPPYGIDFNDSDKAYLKKRFEYLVQRIRNSFLYFIGIANELLKTGGVFSYIVPNEFLFQIYMEKARKYFLTNTEFHIAINAGEEVFEAIVPSCIVLIKKQNLNNYSISLKDLRGKELQELFKDLKTETFDLTPSSQILESPNATFSFNKSKSKLVNELLKRTKPFEEYCEDVANGISTSCDEIYIVDADFAKANNFEMNYLKPSIRGSHFNKFYCPEKTDEFVLYVTPDFEEEEAPNIYSYLKENKDLLIKKCVEKNSGTRKWHLLFRHRDETLFVSPKIIIRQTGDRIIAAIDNNNYYCINSVHVAKIKEQYFEKMPFLIGLLNSQLSRFIYQEISQESGRVMAEVKPQRVRQMPIAIASSTKEKGIERLVDKIILKKKSNLDTTSLEKEIDVLVYKLYELSYEEVKVVDPAFWLSAEEYENFKTSVNERS